MLWFMIKRIPDDKMLCLGARDIFIQITQMSNMTALWREGFIIHRVLAQSRGVARSQQAALKCLPVGQHQVVRCNQTPSGQFLSHLTPIALAVKGMLVTLKDYFLLEGNTGRQKCNVCLIMTLKSMPNWSW